MIFLKTLLSLELEILDGKCTGVRVSCPLQRNVRAKEREREREREREGERKREKRVLF